MAHGKVDYRKVQKIELDGRSFRSKAESQAYLWLKSLERAGELENIRCEHRVELLPGKRGERIDYYADFVVFDKISDEDIYIEVKGFEDARWLLKKKLWSHFGPGLLRIYKVGWNRLDLAEEIRGRQGRIVYGKENET